MQRLSSTQDSAMTLDDLLATHEPGNDSAHKIKSRDEKVLSLAPLNESYAEEQVDNVSAPSINVDAQTVFTVASDPRRRGMIYIAGSVVVLAASAIVIPMFYFKHVAPSSADVTTSKVITGFAADDIARQISAAADIRKEEISDLTPAVISATAKEEPVEKSFKDIGIPGRADENLGQHETPSSTSDAEISPAETLDVATSELSSPLAATAHLLTLDTKGAAIMDDATDSDREEIHIIRGKVPDRTGALINAAYAAYVAGNYSDARQAYLGVLQELPGHRYALLGMAAIAQRTGDPDEAGRIRLQVLAEYPDDPVATAALIDLIADQDYTGSARTIMKLLQNNPHAAFLYFSLGNIQAAASRWPEARQAFTEACRLEGDNPDYAYNLAVSLEHTGDTRTALDSYRTALDLAQDRPVNFDSSVVMARITVLSEIFHGR